MMNKFMDILIGIVALFTIYILFLMFWPYKVYEVYTQPLPVTPTIVNAGERITVHVDSEKFMEIPSLCSSLLFNDTVILLPDTKSNLPKGKIDIKWKVKIPNYADSGTYRVRITLTFRVNFLRDIVQTYETEPFTVKKLQCEEKD